MNLLFFQNIISPHQMPYIQHLPKMEGVDKVVVIVPEVNLEERDSLGWNTEKWLQTEGIRFLVAPTEEEVERVLKVNETLRYETRSYETRSYETLRYETLRYENVNQNENQNENGNVNETPTLRKATGRRTKFGNDTSLRNADATKTIDGNGNGNHNENQNENEKQGVTWCLFSGINAFPEVAKWFRMSLKYNVRRGVITEPPYVYDHPLWQHAIRFALKDWRYVKYIDKIFVMGEDYLSYYRFWSKRWEVIPFMYCTEENNVLCKQSEQARANETLRYENENENQNQNVNDNDNENENENDNVNENDNDNDNENQNENHQPSDFSHQPSPIRHQPSDFSRQPSDISHQPSTIRHHLKILYVGSLSPRKNVGCLLKAAMLLSKEEQEQLEIGIVGDGDEREALERLADGLVTPVRFYGTQPMGMIPDIMGQYDVLVLPSLHDGWGAVVNEALMLGLYVICSDHCGAKMLIKEENNGLVFKSNNPTDLSNCIASSIRQCKQIRSSLMGRREWSMLHISGKAVATYFYNYLTC